MNFTFLQNTTRKFRLRFAAVSGKSEEQVLEGAVRILRQYIPITDLSKPNPILTADASVAPTETSTDMCATLSGTVTQHELTKVHVIKLITNTQPFIAFPQYYMRIYNWPSGEELHFHALFSSTASLYVGWAVIQYFYLTSNISVIPVAFPSVGCILHSVSYRGQHLQNEVFCIFYFKTWNRCEILLLPAGFA